MIGLKMIEICIVASKRRKPLIIEYLKTDSYKISYTPDYPLPKGFKPNPVNFRSQNELGAYRCFRGHQDALRMIKGTHALIIEDDAVPNVDNWLAIAEKAVELLPDFQIVSLHGRRVERRQEPIKCGDFVFNELLFIEKKFPIVSQNIQLRWSIGSLAYLIRCDAMYKFLNTEYFGMGVDLFIANHFTFCVIETSPFDHDRRMGSLVSKPR